MFVKVKFPTTVDGVGRVVPDQIIALTGAEAIPLIKSGNVLPRPGLGAVADNDPDDLERLKEKARQAGQNVDWFLQPPKRPQAGVAAMASGESFGQKLKEAVKKRTAGRSDTRQAHGKNAEKERSRYRKPVRRAPCKGE